MDNPRFEQLKVYFLFGIVIALVIALIDWISQLIFLIGQPRQKVLAPLLQELP